MIPRPLPSGCRALLTIFPLLVACNTGHDAAASDRTAKQVPVETERPVGTIGEGDVFFDATAWVPDRQGLPDGMKVDRQGDLFATGPGGVLVLTPEGVHLGTIRSTQATDNCAFGDEGRFLYMSADSYLLLLRS